MSKNEKTSGKGARAGSAMPLPEVSPLPRSPFKINLKEGSVTSESKEWHNLKRLVEGHLSRHKTAADLKEYFKSSQHSRQRKWKAWNDTEAGDKRDEWYDRSYQFHYYDEKDTKLLDFLLQCQRHASGRIPYASEEDMWVDYLRKYERIGQESKDIADRKAHSYELNQAIRGAKKAWNAENPEGPAFDVEAWKVDNCSVWNARWVLKGSYNTSNVKTPDKQRSEDESDSKENTEVQETSPSGAIDKAKEEEEQEGRHDDLDEENFEVSDIDDNDQAGGDGSPSGSDSSDSSDESSSSSFESESSSVSNGRTRSSIGRQRKPRSPKHSKGTNKAGGGKEEDLTVKMSKDEIHQIQLMLGDLLDTSAMVAGHGKGFNPKDKISVDMPKINLEGVQNLTRMESFLSELRRYLANQVANKRQVPSLNMMVDPKALRHLMWKQHLGNVKTMNKTTDLEKMSFVAEAYKELKKATISNLKDTDFSKIMEELRSTNVTMANARTMTMSTYVSLLQQLVMQHEPRLTPEKLMSAFGQLMPEEVRNYYFMAVQKSLQEEKGDASSDSTMEDYFRPNSEEKLFTSFRWFLDSADGLDKGNVLPWHQVISVYKDRPPHRAVHKDIIQAFYTSQQYKVSILGEDKPAKYGGRYKQITDRLGPKPNTGVRSVTFAEEDRKCFQCGSTEHIKRDCPVAKDPKRKRETESRKCHHCNKEGHIKSECPVLRGQLKGGGAVKCTNCFKLGHTSHACTEICMICSKAGKTHLQSASNNGHRFEDCRDHPSKLGDKIAKRVRQNMARANRRKNAKRKAEQELSQAMLKKNKVEEMKVEEVVEDS
jgi:hypothetical protein